MADNVVLIGMMGSGKTTVGRAVADQAGMDFVDLDEMVEDRAGMGIPDIFAQSGEGRFRELETEALRELVAAHHTVLATGGGIVTRAENRRLLRELGKVFWLDAPAETLLSRIGDDENRPMLRGGDPLKRIEALLAERREFYGEASDIHLDTSELRPRRDRRAHRCRHRAEPAGGERCVRHHRGDRRAGGEREEFGGKGARQQAGFRACGHGRHVPLRDARGDAPRRRVR